MALDSSPIDWLMSTQSRGVVPGLQRMERLLKAMGNPEQRLRCLHVAGTNGKGSVCALSESVLRAAGYRTGLYTSPHLVDFSERIRVNGKNANSTALEEGILGLRKVTGGWGEADQPTFFELVTALAFEYFAKEGCEIVVLETGLGGRLDATNTAPKLACAITPIGLDHTEWLGESLPEIAREKAGIFRTGIPAVIAPQVEEVRESLARVAQEQGVPCHWVTEALDEALVVGLRGSHQRWNAATALRLLEIAGFQIAPEVRALGVAGVTWPGRFQRLGAEGLILDGAHNVHAARQLVAVWREEFAQERCRLIFGALADKDPATILRILSPIASEIYLVPVASSRSMDPEILARFAGDFSPTVHVFSSLAEALKLVETSPPSSQVPVLLAGSLFLVGEALALVSGRGVSLRSQ